jgi:hypothetical protein
LAQGAQTFHHVMTFVFAGWILLMLLVLFRTQSFLRVFTLGRTGFSHTTIWIYRFLAIVNAGGALYKLIEGVTNWAR